MNQSSNNTDVVIVGAGIIGIACAHYLSESGAKVTVIDQNTVGSQCSFGNCGYICPSHVLPLATPGAISKALKSMFEPSSAFRVKPQFDMSLIKWFWQFSKLCKTDVMLETGHHLNNLLVSSKREYTEVIEQLDFDCEWKKNGLLYVAETQNGLDDLRAKSELLAERYGVSSHLISGEELLSFDPALRTGLAGAYHFEDDASINPNKLNQQWYQYLKEKGVEFVEDCSLTGVNKLGNQVSSIETSKGVFKADNYVIAAGAWSAKLASELDCKIPIQPGKGYSLTTNNPDICPEHPMLFPEHGVGVSPFKDGYRIGSIMEFAGFNTSIPSKRIEQLKASAQRYLVGQSNEEWKYTWQGWRPMTWDSLPIIGRIPKLHNTFLSTGHNMLGMSLGAVTGKLISEMIQGVSTHIDTQAFSPERFN